jgi:hypothetical protein
VVYLHWVSSRSLYSVRTYRHHRAVANIAKLSLRFCLQRKPTFWIIRSYLRLWKQIPNLYIAPLPTAVCCKLKVAERAVCAFVMPTTVHARWPGIFKGLSQDGGLMIFSKKLRASLSIKYLPNEPNFIRLHHARTFK